MTNFGGKKVAVVGFGAEGQSAARFIEKEGASVTILDHKSELVIPDSYKKNLGDNYLDDLEAYDVVVNSPGVKRDLLSNAKQILSPTQIFFDECKAQVIGVTGTKGKGTTSTLISKMLEMTGKRVHLGGNIGKPAIELLSEIESKDDWVILELSSFQLYDLKTSPKIAVVLMIDEDHLDWHRDIEDYLTAKSNIAKYQVEGDICIYNGLNEKSRLVADIGDGQKIAYMTEEAAYIKDDHLIIDDSKICKVSEVGLVGKHNLENICAAISAVWQVDKDPKILRQAIKEFKGLEHRLEFVRAVNGIKFYNDSFATNPSATIAAMRSFTEPLVLIVGGSEKGTSYDEMAKSITRSSVKCVVGIGETGDAIIDEIKSVDKSKKIKYVSLGTSTNMNEIVKKANAESVKGDIVLLSPAAASFGLFESYKQRGKLFKEHVNKL